MSGRNNPTVAQLIHSYMAYERAGKRESAAFVAQRMANLCHTMASHHAISPERRAELRGLAQTWKQSAIERLPRLASTFKF